MILPKHSFYTITIVSSISNCASQENFISCTLFNQFLSCLDSDLAKRHQFSIRIFSRFSPIKQIVLPHHCTLSSASLLISRRKPSISRLLAMQKRNYNKSGDNISDLSLFTTISSSTINFTNFPSDFPNFCHIISSKFFQTNIWCFF